MGARKQCINGNYDKEIRIVSTESLYRVDGIFLPVLIRENRDRVCPHRPRFATASIAPYSFFATASLASRA